MTYLKHLYYGDGKGKTTAAIGAAIRARGNGIDVLFVQFLKGLETGEIPVLKELKIDVIRSEDTKKFYKFMTKEEQVKCKNEQENCFKQVFESVKSGKYKMIVLDEVLDTEEIVGKEPIENIVDACNNAELIITGHRVWQSVLDKMDYISEVKCIKHPFNKGITARKGIEF